MADALEQVRTRFPGVPQKVQDDPREVRNAAGGFVFELPGEARLHRFLTMGTEGGTYYIKQQKLTADAAGVCLDWARNRTSQLVAKAVEISVAGRAPSNDQALFALAAAISMGDLEGRQLVVTELPKVARTGYHLSLFVKYAEQFRGWGTLLERAVANWFLVMDPEALAYQAIKYRQRNGWRPRDLVIKAHPRGDDGEGDEHNVLFNYLIRKETTPELLSGWVGVYEELKGIERDVTMPKQLRGMRYEAMVREHRGTPWEALPDEARTFPNVWQALVENGMPMTALIRNLPILTNKDLLAPFSPTLKLVCDQLQDTDKLVKARVHPVQLLLALKTYAAGRNMRGRTTWRPVIKVCDALSEGFYNAFPAVEPAGKNTALCTDVSGSMTGWTVGRYPFLAAEIVGAMAMVTARTEPNTELLAFGTSIVPLNISPSMRLDGVMRAMFNAGGYGTDCSQPILWAIKNKVPVETFQLYTDNETWAGTTHVHTALARHRQLMGYNTRLSVISVYPSEYSIADPDDPATLDVSGFDSAIPTLLTDFSRGDL
jgi:60 kDa SS-A/Ro ribonucleoprotein